MIRYAGRLFVELPVFDHGIDVDILCRFGEPAHELAERSYYEELDEIAHKHEGHGQIIRGNQGDEETSESIARANFEAHYQHYESHDYTHEICEHAHSVEKKVEEEAFIEGKKGPIAVDIRHAERLVLLHIGDMGHGFQPYGEGPYEEEVENLKQRLSHSRAYF